jgi:hypothetical protein
MKTRTELIRNAAFYVTLAVLAAFVMLLGPIPNGLKPQGDTFNRCVDVLSIAFGVSGLVVVLLTIRLKEVRTQKLFFLLAGGAALGFLITLMLHGPIDRLALSLFGPQPEDFTEGLVLGVFPILFIIGALGSIVFLVKGRIAKGSKP